MTKFFVLAALAAPLLFSETTDLTGVWKADLAKSKRMGPPIENYLVIIEQKNAVFNNRTKEEAPLITETTGTWNQRGENRAIFSYFPGKTSVRLYSGVPTRLSSTVQANGLVLKGEPAGHPNGFTRTYVLSSDHKTLTVDEDSTAPDGKPLHTSMVLLKQEEAAGEPLRKPEETAEKHFKNIKTASLKNLPVSEVINRMHYFSWALGKECLFCHVERKFDSDDKKEKEAARKMIDMVAATNEHSFEGKEVVRCFTCHEGRPHPLSRQLYADEVEAEKAAAAKEAAERAAHQPPPPGQTPPPSQH